MDRAELETLYRGYLQHCNDRRFDALGEFVDENVELNGLPWDLQRYAEGLAEVVKIFPDFRWEVQHLLVDGPYLAAHLVDTATTEDGLGVTTQELAVYRVDGGRIVQVWGDLDAGRLLLDSIPR